jgi:hypothetical protein
MVKFNEHGVMENPLYDMTLNIGRHVYPCSEPLALQRMVECIIWELEFYHLSYPNVEFLREAGNSGDPYVVNSVLDDLHAWGFSRRINFLL